MEVNRGRVWETEKGVSGEPIQYSELQPFCGPIGDNFRQRGEQGKESAQTQ
jgi:hypothetical protein